MPTIVDLDEIIKASFEDIQPVVQVPRGTWKWRCKALTKKVDHEGNPYWCLTLQPVLAYADVDPGELFTWQDGGDPDAVVFHSAKGGPRTIANTLKEIGVAAGVKNAEQLVGAEFRASLAWDENKRDPSRPWSRISNFAPVADSTVDDD